MQWVRHDGEIQSKVSGETNRERHLLVAFAHELGKWKSGSCAKSVRSDDAKILLCASIGWESREDEGRVDKLGATRRNLL